MLNDMENIEMEKNNTGGQIRPEMSDLIVTPEGNIEKRVEDAIANAHKTLERVDAEGGIDAVVAEAEKLPEDRKAYWEQKRQEARANQEKLGTGSFGGSDESFENAWEGMKATYYLIRRFFAAGSKK